MELVLDNSYTRINFTEGDEFKKIVEEELHYKLGVKQEGYVYSPAYKNGHWDGIIQFYEPDKQRFPTGLVPKVEEILGELQERINFTYTINDDRPDAFVPLDELPDKVTLLDDEVGEITLRDYQYDAFRSTLEHRMSVLHLATNAGKCITSDSVLDTDKGKLTLQKFFEKAGYELGIEEKVVRYTGDLALINRYGKPEKPSHLTFNGERETVILETIYQKGSNNIQATENHPLLTYDFEDKKFSWKLVRDIEISDFLVSLEEGYQLKDYPEFYVQPVNKKYSGGIKPTFDVAMPETHSFIANGIINHNTEVAGGFIKEVYKRLEPGETIAFFTMSKEIFNQTHKRLEQRLGIEVGKYGAGKKDIKKVNVVMVPTISASLKIDPEKGVKLTAKERIVKKMAKDIAPAYAKGVNQKTLLKAFLMNFEAKTKADADLVFEIEKIIYESESDAKVKFKLNGYVVQYEKILEKKNEGKLKKKKDVLDFLHSIVAFVSDEHQHVSADSLYNTLLACENAIYRVGLSGSIDQKNKMLLRRIEAVTGKVTSRTTTEFLVEEGHSAKPYINLIPIYGVEENTVKVDISGLKEYQQVYESGIVRNEYRNKLIAKITEMCYNRDQGVLIVVNRIEHGDTISMLLDLLSVPHEFLQGEIVDEEREAKLSMMRSGELKVMIATSIMDEGVDISGIDVLIMGAGGKSLRQTVQRVGRAVRKKKGKANEAQIYDFYDRTHDYLYRHSKARHKIYEEERFDINFIE